MRSDSGCRVGNNECREAVAVVERKVIYSFQCVGEWYLQKWSTAVECLLTDTQFTQLQKEISQKIKAKEDIVVYYSICVDCYTKIVYQPKPKRTFEKVSVV